MNPLFTDFINGRLEEITEELRQTNGEYALAVKARKELRERLNPVIMSGKELTLFEADFLDIQEYLEYEFTAAAIEQRAFYRQGWLDCAELLRRLGMG